MEEFQTHIVLIIDRVESLSGNCLLSYRVKTFQLAHLRQLKGLYYRDHFMRRSIYLEGAKESKKRQRQLIIILFRF